MKKKFKKTGEQVGKSAYNGLRPNGEISFIIRTEKTCNRWKFDIFDLTGVSAKISNSQHE